MTKFSLLVLLSGLMWVHIAAAGASPTLEMPVGFIPVESRVFDGVAYDTREHALWLWFDRGGIYCYHGITFDRYRELLDSVNKGRFFNTHLRSRYAYHKVGAYPCPSRPVEKPMHVAMP